MMRIVVDAMGGDHAPAEIVKGACRAAKDFQLEVILVGDKAQIAQVIAAEHLYTDTVSIVHATQKIEMCDTPTKAVKEKTDSSMVVAFQLLKEGKADAMVCAGNTGALLAGAIRYLRRIKGVVRPALAPFIPTEKEVTLLIDAGANTNCRPVNLEQFAVMGSVYMANVFGRKNPRVGLLNIGEEENKGDELTKAAYPLLKENPDINFIGNFEARYVPGGTCDVLVCDGFVGNILLKFYEGVGKTFAGLIKNIFKRNIFSKLGYLFVKGGVGEFKKMMDYTEYGGAPLLGVQGAVIKAHGSSNAKAFYYAVKQAKLFSETGVIDEITLKLSKREEQE